MRVKQGAYRRANGLIRWIMPNREAEQSLISKYSGIRSSDLLGVIQSFFTADSFCRVKTQQLAQQVQGQRIGFRIQLMPLLFWFDRQGADVPIEVTACQSGVTRIRVSDSLLSSRASYTSQRILRWGPQNVQDLVQLINIIPALEDRPSSQQFGENAPDRPHVNYIDEKGERESRLPLSIALTARVLKTGEVGSQLDSWVLAL